MFWKDVTGSPITGPETGVQVLEKIDTARQALATMLLVLASAILERFRGKVWRAGVKILSTF